MRENDSSGNDGCGINNVIYMELYSGPKMANGRCGKTIDTGTTDQGSTVYVLSFVACLALPHYVMNGPNFLKKVIEHKTYVLIFSTTFV